MKQKNILFVAVFVFALSLVSATSYNLEFNQIGKQLVIKENINEIQTKNYVDSESMNSAGNEIYFIKKINFPDNFDKAEIKLNLEKGIVVKPEEIFPTDYKIESDGQTLSIIWKLNSVKKSEVLAFFVTLENINRSYIIFYLISGIIVILVIGYFAYKKFSKQSTKQKSAKIKTKHKSKQEKKKEEYDFLLDTEKKVINELKKADRNELWQKQIQNATGFSKAKVSRLIRTLEARGLIKKISFGNTNKIRLI